MKRKIQLIAIVLAGALPLAAFGADDFGAIGTGSTSAQSGTAPGSASSPNTGTQGGPTGNDTGSSPGGAMGVPGSSRDPEAAASSRFGEMDSDGDGALSRSEAQGGGILDSRFEVLDNDRDGRISPSEWQAGDISR